MDNKHNKINNKINNLNFYLENGKLIGSRAWDVENEKSDYDIVVTNKFYMSIKENIEYIRIQDEEVKNSSNYNQNILKNITNFKLKLKDNKIINLIVYKNEETLELIDHINYLMMKIDKKELKQKGVRHYYFENFIQKYLTNDILNIDNRKPLGNKIIKYNDEKYHFDFIISEDFISKNIKKFDSYGLGYCLQYQTLSEEFLEKHIDKFTSNHFSIISQYQKISEQFIKKYSNRLYWDDISYYQDLSESFINKEEFLSKNKDLVNWHWISLIKNLSEDFIIENESYINWHWLTFNQTFSEEFINKHILNINNDSLLDRGNINNLSLGRLFLNQEIKENLLEKLILQNNNNNINLVIPHSQSDYEIDWNMISLNQNLSEKFIEKYKDKINFRLLKNDNKRKDFKITNFIKKIIEKEKEKEIIKIKKEKKIKEKEKIIKERKKEINNKIINNFDDTLIF